MKWYVAKLTAESWIASAWQADTIWGHLCWGLRYRHGEDALLNFLNTCEKGTPPLLVSNGFPGDLLPRPIVPEPGPDKSKGLEAQRKEFGERKSARGRRWLTYEEFTREIQGERAIPAEKEVGSQMVMLKNQINRLTSTTGGGRIGGQLFNFSQYRWKSITIYMKVAADFVERAEELFRYLAQSGYGKRKSVGYGQVKLEAFDPFPGFHVSPDANGFITLSHFVPAAGDPTSGYWDVLIKYGKLGEEFATGENPFKKPLIMLTTGSSFYDSPCKEYYGRLVKGISPVHTDKIVQYGFALPVPMRLPEIVAAEGGRERRQGG
jgi:CRISPR-associated protein Csm4